MKRRQGTGIESEGSEAVGMAKKLSKRAETQPLCQDKQSDTVTSEQAPSVSAPTSESRTEILQTRAELEAGTEKLMTLAQKGAENEVLSQKIRQLEGDLLRETGTSRELRTQVQLLKQALRREKIQNFLRRTAERTTAPLLTQGDKILHLLPDVLKIIIEKERHANVNSIPWEKLRPLLTSCRLVCKSWKQSVDLIIQQDSSHLELGSKNRFLFRYKEDYTPFPLRICYGTFDHTGWTAKLDAISSGVQRNPGYNPIPSRHLVISTGLSVDFDLEQWSNYFNTVKRFLQLVGEQVWFLTVRFDLLTYRKDKVRISMAIYKCLSEWFFLVPNLRSLALYTCITAAPAGWNEHHGRMILPKLKDLVTFEGYQDTHLNYTILKLNNHVKRLGLSRRSRYNPLAGLMEIDLQNVLAFEYDFYDAQEWSMFVDGTTWKLEELSVQFCSSRGPSTEQFSEGVTKLGRTLKSLCFEFCEIKKAKGKNLELTLPQLKSLHLIASWRMALSLELEPLLVSLTSLETFQLELPRLPFILTKVRPPINLEAHFKDINHFHEKVDWSKLPSLQTVKLVGGISEHGTREVFVRSRENMPPIRFNLVKNVTLARIN